MLHLAVPPCQVSAGDSVDVGRTQSVGELWPQVGAPPGEVPRALALALTLEQRDNVWVGACELPGPVRELFTVEDPGAMLSVMTATRRTLGRGSLAITGDPKRGLTFTLLEGTMAAWATTPATVPEAFTYWLDSGPAMGLATALEGAARVTGSLGGLSDFMIANEHGVQARCFLDEERPAPALLGDDYFAHGAAGLGIERPGGLGREALAAIASLRPREVTFQLSGDGRLVISGGPEDPAPFRLDGPGFRAGGEGADLALVVPYMVALALYDGAAGGPVDLIMDAHHGRLHRADHGITVEWQR
jgi:hypothetical protein